MEYKLASSSWDEKEIKAIRQVIKSDMYSMNKKSKNMKTSSQIFFDSKHAVMTSSGSTANLLMIAAMFYKIKNVLEKR